MAVKKPEIIHGLISLEERHGHFFMHLLESSPFNRGRQKKYLGVAGNLVAYACKLSDDCGFDGVVSFDSKTALMEHYEKTLGAVRIGGNKMAIFEDRAMFYISKYFPKMKEEI